MSASTRPERSQRGVEGARCDRQQRRQQQHGRLQGVAGALRRHLRGVVERRRRRRRGHRHVGGGDPAAIHPGQHHDDQQYARSGDQRRRLLQDDEPGRDDRLHAQRAVPLRQTRLHHQRPELPADGVLGDGQRCDRKIRPGSDPAGPTWRRSRPAPNSAETPRRYSISIRERSRRRAQRSRRATRPRIPIRQR